MIEINGWVTIYTTTDGEGKADELSRIIRQIDKLITPFEILNQILEIKTLNGIPTLFIGINHNHDNGHSDSIHKLLCEIGNIAIGSYGIIHMRYHEDEIDFNTFKILKLAKGRVTIEDDKLLSPCNPIIED